MIYLDHNATTPVAAEVLDAVRLHVEGEFGNPSSNHRYGKAASAAVELARAQVAEMLGCAADSVVFTGSDSEADNLAIKGVALARRDHGDHIVASAIEHPAVLGACRYLEARFGNRVTRRAGRRVRRGGPGRCAARH